jgi:vacuolar-type H+-ATPase subunit H
MSSMTKYEREDLQRLVRQREKVLKSAAKQRSAEVLADFENQMGQEFRFDQDEVWAEASRLAEAAVSKAQEQIKALLAAKLESLIVSPHVLV